MRSRPYRSQKNLLIKYLDKSCDGCEFSGGGGGSVMVGVIMIVVIVGVLAMVVGFREVMMT